MVSILKLQRAVIDEFDSRNLKSRTRYNTLSNVIKFINAVYKGNVSCLGMDKAKFKEQFTQYNHSTFSGAANGAINELFNQYALLKEGGTNNKVSRENVQKQNHNKPLVIKDAKNRISSFKPLIDANSEVLILGTMPGPESLQTGEYYTSKHNSFWKIMAMLFNDGKTFGNYDEKIACLHKKHIALWDVFEFCERDGASDSSIRNEKRNDIEGLLKKYPSIRKIILNGNKAADGFNAPIPFEKVCSSSSYITLEEKVNVWGKSIKG